MEAIHILLHRLPPLLRPKLGTETGGTKQGGGNRLDYVTKARSYPILMLKSLRSSLYLGCLSASFCEPINRAARVDCNLTSTAYITSDCDGCSFSGASSNPRLQSQ